MVPRVRMQPRGRGWMAQATVTIAILLALSRGSEINKQYSVMTDWRDLMIDGCTLVPGYELNGINCTYLYNWYIGSNNIAGISTLCSIMQTGTQDQRSAFVDADTGLMPDVACCMCPTPSATPSPSWSASVTASPASASPSPSYLRPYVVRDNPLCVFFTNDWCTTNCNQGNCHDECCRDECGCDNLLTANGEVWTNIEGLTCERFEDLWELTEFYSQQQYCAVHQFSEGSNMEMGEACCFCGGGRMPCVSPTPVPVTEDGQVCQCEDKPSVVGGEWTDLGGHTCQRFETLMSFTEHSTSEYCGIFSFSADTDGMTLTEACCFCGGGECLVFSNSPTPAASPSPSSTKACVYDDETICDSCATAPNQCHAIVHSYCDAAAATDEACAAIQTACAFKHFDLPRPGRLTNPCVTAECWGDGALSDACEGTKAMYCLQDMHLRGFAVEGYVPEVGCDTVEVSTYLPNMQTVILIQGQDSDVTRGNDGQTARPNYADYVPEFDAGGMYRVHVVLLGSSTQNVDLVLFEVHQVLDSSTVTEADAYPSGGEWDLGTAIFAPGNGGFVRIRSDCSTIACPSFDLRLELVEPQPEILMDSENGLDDYVTLSTHFNPNGFSSTGRYHGTTYAYARSTSAYAYYRPPFQAPGLYEVSTTFFGASNREASCPYLVQHADGNTVVYMNQTVNGEDFLSIGEFLFYPNSEHGVSILGTGTTGFLIADAIKMTLVGGSDWSTVILPPDEVILMDSENGEADRVVLSHHWQTGSSPWKRYHGDTYEFAQDSSATATFTPHFVTAARYQVWTTFMGSTNRDLRVPYVIHHDGPDSPTTVYVDQTANGEDFISLGSYDFARGHSNRIIISGQGTTGLIVADAIKLTLHPSASPSPSPADTSSDVLQELIMDSENGAADHVSLSSHFNTQGASSSGRYHGAKYAFARSASATATYSPMLPAAGRYEVSTTWFGASNRDDAVRYIITHAGADSPTVVNVDQTQNGENFVTLGTFDFAAGSGSSIVISGQGTSGFIVADAIKLTHTTASGTGSEGTGDTTTLPVVLMDSENGAADHVSLSSHFNTQGASSSGRYHGAKYAFARSASATATYSPMLPAAGRYEVSTTWFGASNRDDAVRYIITHAGADSPTVVNVDQTQNGENFVTLGTFDFAAGSGSSIVISGQGTSGFIVADAIKLTHTTASGTGSEGTGSPSSAEQILLPTVGAVTTDAEGHVIIILDSENGASDNVVMSSRWSTGASSSRLYNGRKYHYSRTESATAQFTPELTTAGSYEVSASWYGASNRDDNVLYMINHAGGTTMVRRSQRNNDEEWNSLGTYEFAAGSMGNVVVSGQDTSGFIVADAIKFRSDFVLNNSSVSAGTDVTLDPDATPLPVVLMDSENGAADHVSLSSHFNTQGASSSGRYHGAKYAFARSASATATYSPMLPAAGRYEVSTTWFGASNRDDAVRYIITHAGADSPTVVNVDQTQNGENFVTLGTFDFAAGSGSSIVISGQGTSGFIVADAIKLTLVTAVLPDATPQPTIILDSENGVSDNVVMSSRWSTGASSSRLYNGEAYHYSRTESATAQFTPSFAAAGTYQVSASWYGASNRDANVLYIINHAGGTTRVRRDQRNNDEEWNSLGTYEFESGSTGYVVVSGEGTSGFVVADAIRFLLQLSHCPAGSINPQCQSSSPDYTDAVCEAACQSGPSNCPSGSCSCTGVQVQLTWSESIAVGDSITIACPVTASDAFTGTVQVSCENSGPQIVSGQCDWAGSTTSTSPSPSPSVVYEPDHSAAVVVDADTPLSASVTLSSHFSGIGQNQAAQGLIYYYAKSTAAQAVYTASLNACQRCMLLLPLLQETPMSGPTRVPGVPIWVRA